jgi:hypothetical protein
MMLIQRRSPRTGQINVREINCTPEQIIAWDGGRCIQDVMPDVSKEDREFLMTGYTPEDWAIIFPPEPPHVHQWEEQPGEPPRDVCVSCGEERH